MSQSQESLPSRTRDGFDVVPGAPMPRCEQRWLELKQGEKSGGMAAWEMGGADEPDGLDHPAEIAQKNQLSISARMV